MNRPTGIQKTEHHVTTTFTGDTTIPLFTTTTPLFKEELVRDEQTIEDYLPLTYALGLKRKQQKLYVHMVFEKNPTVNALADSGAFFSATSQNDLDTKEEKAPNNFLKFDDHPNFEIQVPNGQLEKPLATATPKIEKRDSFFAEKLRRD